MPNKTKPLSVNTSQTPALPRQALLGLSGLLGVWVCTLAQGQTQTPPPTPPLASAPAQPQGPAACPASFASQPPTDTEDQRAALRRAQAHSLACENRFDYHAHLGGLLLALKQTVQAANALEKSLMLEPEQPGTQLDYAHALALLGETAIAQEIVNQVSARPDIHPSLRQWLRDSTGERPTATPHWSWAQLLQTTAGHETNLSSATHANAITLFLSNGPVLVPLDDGAKPQSGAGLKNLLAVQGQSPAGGPDLRLTMALQTRHASGVPENHMAALSATYVKPWGQGQLHVRWDGHHFQRNNSFTYQDHGLALQYHFAPWPTPCKWRTSLGSADQQFSGNTSLNGRLTQARLEGSCKHADQSETHWGLGTGQDKAQTNQRPGGDKTRQDWTIRHERLVGKVVTQAWLRQTKLQDSERFSPLLGDLVSRSTRIDWGTGAWWPVAPQWSAGLDVESTSQKSSNVLLNIKNLSIYAGLRWTSK